MVWWAYFAIDSSGRRNSISDLIDGAGEDLVGSEVRRFKSPCLGYVLMCWIWCAERIVFLIL